MGKAMMAPAEHFGVVLDRLTGKVRRVFNPTAEWEFVVLRVDGSVEYLRVERKAHWGVPPGPDAMTLAMAARIVTEIERGSNFPPSDGHAP